MRRVRTRKSAGKERIYQRHTVQQHSLIGQMVLRFSASGSMSRFKGLSKDEQAKPSRCSQTSYQDTITVAYANFYEVHRPMPTRNWLA